MHKLKKINTKWTPKIKNPAQTNETYVNWGKKIYLSRKDPIIGSMDRGGEVIS